MRLLFLGDMVGKSGRTAVWEQLPGLISDFRLDFVIVNGENAAGGFGITEEIFQTTLAAGADVDVAALRSALVNRVPTATVDDHRGWIGRMRAVADVVVVGGIIVLGLVIAVTILCVNFATRGAMAANRPVIEVLHFIGAQDRFIAGQFQRHFLWLGLKGGLFGGFAAIVLFALIVPVEAIIRGNAGPEQFAALFGSLTLGFAGYLVIFVQILVIAAVASEASRRTVNQTIASI